jgi:hypothetical protein
MKKIPPILFGVLLAALISIPTTSLAQTDILTPWWINPEYRGYENLLFNEYIIAYLTGTTAKLSVPVENDYNENINVTAVQASLDWGKTYNSTECSESNPLEIEEDDIHTFTITFTVPTTTIASNLAVHDWEVIVNYEKGGEPHTDLWRNEWAPGHTYYFAVFSSDQAEAFQLYNEMDAAFGYNPYFSTAKAEALWGEAEMQNSIGQSYYRSGKFAEANTTLHIARDLVDQAFEAEDERGSKLEDAQMNYHNAAMTQAYTGLLLGLGIVFIGIGAIIYAIKKPRATRARKRNAHA